MNYIEENNNEYIWDQIKIINSHEELLDLKENNIYLIKNNTVHILYIKIYNYLHHDQFQTRDEALLSLHLKNSRELKYLGYGYTYNKIENRCEFCFNMYKMLIPITTNKFKDIMICRKCYTSKQSKSYYINDTSFESNINMEIIKKVKDDLIYFYSIKRHPDDFCCLKLLNNKNKIVDFSENCRLCHKHIKLNTSECLQCYQFSLDQYHIISTKVKYFGSTNYLHQDIISVIIKLYIMLYGFNQSDFIDNFIKVRKIIS